MYVNNTLDKKVIDFRSHYPKDTIHLGLVLAGAVSAGAYTAGAVTYLFQNFDKWEALKNNNYQALYNYYSNIVEIHSHENLESWIVENWEALHSAPGFDREIPMHDVVIDVMAGSSAGSLVAAIASLSLGYIQEPIEAEKLLDFENVQKGEFQKLQPLSKLESFHNNLLFDSWVNLNNGQARTGSLDVLESMLSIDKHEHEKGFSLVNGMILDEVRDFQVSRLFGQLDEINASKQHYDICKIPAFISDNFKLFFTVTSLRGIPVSVIFDGDKQGENKEATAEYVEHKMRKHALLMQFSRNIESQSLTSKDSNSTKENQYHMPWNPESKMDSLKLLDSALASGAFPIGLPPRKISLKTDYLKEYFKQLLPQGMENIRVEFTGEMDFDFEAVDGGTLNNEPFTEALDYLLKQCPPNQSPDKPLHLPAIIMIDPFPNHEDKPDVFIHHKNIIDIAKALFNAIRGQAMNKDLQVFNRMKNLVEQRTQGNEMAFVNTAKDPNPLNNSYSNNKVDLKTFKLGFMKPLRKNQAGCSITPSLATSSLSGFGGFLKKEFRLHDFYLGMKNAQGFINKYYSFTPEDPIERKIPKPIIPDIKSPVNEVSAKAADVNTNYVPKKPTSKDFSPDHQSHEYAQKMDVLPQIEFPLIKVSELLSIRLLVRKRLHFLLSQVLDVKREKKDDKKKALKWKRTKLAYLKRGIPIVILASCISIVVWLFCHLDMEEFWTLIISIFFLIWFVGALIMHWLTILVLRAIGNELYLANQLEGYENPKA